MNEQAVREWRGRSLKVAEVALYSVLVLLVMLLLVCVPARTPAHDAAGD
jgi:hypothetical protein